MERFDEKGNFVNPPKPEIIDDLVENNPFQHTTSDKGFQIVYHFKNEEN